MTQPVTPIGAPTQIASLTPTATVRPDDTVAQETSFAAALGDLIANANADLKRAETISVAGMKGEAETHEVVTALMSAEQSLRMAMAVRDKVVQAYLDLSRMQI